MPDKNYKKIDSAVQTVEQLPLPKKRLFKANKDDSIFPVGYVQELKITNDDKEQLNLIKNDGKHYQVGQKRGRRVLQFSEYCDQTAQRIKELKELLFDPKTEEDERNKLRNQISAYQARLKSRITSMDQQVRLDQRDKQITGIIQIASSFLSSDKAAAFLKEIKKRLPDLDTNAKPKEIKAKMEEDTDG